MSNYSPGETHDCPHCGAHYEIHFGGTSPYRDQDRELCVVCKKQMASWNDTFWPKFKLIKTP